MTYLELWFTGRFDEALALARTVGDDQANVFVPNADARLRLMREHGVPVVVRASPDVSVLELHLGGATLRFEDGCLYEDGLRPYVCDPRRHDPEPFLAALAHAAQVELPPPGGERPWPLGCSMTVWSGEQVHAKAHKFKIGVGAQCILALYLIDDGLHVGTLAPDDDEDLATTLRALAAALRGEADPAADEVPMFDAVEAWGSEYPRIVGDGLCAMRDGVLVYSPDGGPRVTPVALDVALLARKYAACDGNLYAPQVLVERSDGALCILDLRAEPRVIDLGLRADAGIDVSWDPHAALVALTVDDGTHVFDTTTGERRGRISGFPVHWESRGLLYEADGDAERLTWWCRDGHSEPATWDGFRTFDESARVPLERETVMYPAVPATRRSGWFGATGFVQRRGAQDLDAVTDTSTGATRFLFGDPRLRLVEVSATGAFAVAREHKYSWAAYVVARRRA